jgi:hypothetical protein
LPHKKTDFGTPKMEKALFCDETKIGLHGIPRHPKGHARIRYGLVPTNNAMIRTEPSSFDLKAIQPRTLQVIYVISG